jgi:hypothetical protein
MGTKLNTESLIPSTILNIRGQAGQFFQGTILSRKQQKSPYKKEDGTVRMFDIYEMSIEDTDMATQRKEGKEYVDVPVKVGDTVTVFAPTKLNNALRQVNDGTRVKFTYLGLGKAANGGGKPHMYEVEAL